MRFFCGFSRSSFHTDWLFEKWSHMSSCQNNSHSQQKNQRSHLAVISFDRELSRGADCWQLTDAYQVWIPCLWILRFHIPFTIWNPFVLRAKNVQGKNLFFHLAANCFEERCETQRALVSGYFGLYQWPKQVMNYKRTMLQDVQNRKKKESCMLCLSDSFVWLLLSVR